ncbi:hypothetical protein Hypma_001739 [Hypsizygus marmoreus]|uniref:AB hydrolase-1 domain-containing protein n=1 Tax=Hypsizygus marmoreus TaxID=39966 RepID=A0A369J6S4_HYPMA|nr:hypothetical protein Hypma_001739 [Hypsizygus marmoreus]
MSDEKLLILPDRRTLAYEHAGDLTSSIVVVFFPGTLSVGSAARLSPVLLSKGVHYISPTLPGYGNSSPAPKNVPYATTTANDLTALLDNLYPSSRDNLELYIGGGSLGTVPAQMIYGAPFSVFPWGKNIKGMLLLSPFPPFSEKGYRYAQYMSYRNYLAIGPPARFVPFRLIQHLSKLYISSQISTPARAEAFIQKFLFDTMEAEEREMYMRWREDHAYYDGELQKELAAMMRRSVEKSWEGFMSTADVLYASWGWKLGELDEEHTAGRKVLVVSGKGDETTPSEWAEYLTSKYPNASLKWIEGGHISGIFHMDEIWADFMGG